MKNIPFELRNLREQRAYTQSFIAEKLGVSIRAYSKIERGETQLTLERLYQICSILDISVIEFLKDKSLKTKDKDEAQQNTADLLFMKQHYEETIAILKDQIDTLKAILTK